MLTGGTRVRVVFVGDVQVADLYTEEELGEMVRNPEKMAYFAYAADIGVSYTKIFRIDIESIAAKRKQYDENAVERKKSDD